MKFCYCSVFSVINGCLFYVTGVLCFLAVLVVPSCEDLLSGVQLVTDVSNGFVPKLFQVYCIFVYVEFKKETLLKPQLRDPI